MSAGEPTLDAAWSWTGREPKFSARLAPMLPSWTRVDGGTPGVGGSGGGRCGGGDGSGGDGDGGGGGGGLGSASVKGGRGEAGGTKKRGPQSAQSVP